MFHTSSVNIRSTPVTAPVAVSTIGTARSKWRREPETSHTSPVTPQSSSTTGTGPLTNEIEYTAGGL
jgi:hypothetical protein